MTSERFKKIRFADHARRKFEFLRKYEFEVSEATVKEAVASPSHVDRRGDQILALKPVDRECAIRVGYKIVNDNIVGVS